MRHRVALHVYERKLSGELTPLGRIAAGSTEALPAPPGARVVVEPVEELTPATVGALLDELRRLARARPACCGAWLRSTRPPGRASARLPALVRLDLDGSDVDDARAAGLAHLPALAELYLADTAVGDATAAVIGGLRRLTTLDLSGTAVGDRGTAALAHLVHLHELSLARTRIGDPGLEPLGGLVELEMVDLSETAHRRLRPGRAGAGGAPARALSRPAPPRATRRSRI